MASILDSLFGTEDTVTDTADSEESTFTFKLNLSVDDCETIVETFDEVLEEGEENVERVTFEAALPVDDLPRIRSRMATFVADHTEESNGGDA